MKLFFYNKKSLSYDKVGQQKYVNVIGWLLIFIIGILLSGIRLGIYYCENNMVTGSSIDYHKYETLTKEDRHPTHNKVHVDSIFNIYLKRAELYLGRKRYQSSPIKSGILTHCARNAYEEFGIILPIELALTQAQIESSMGMEGRSPTKNPYNIGETDKGTTQYFETTVGGVQAYYNTMCEKYLSCRTTEELLLNFVNCNGHRYASSETYESAMSTQYIKIKRWIDSNID